MLGTRYRVSNRKSINKIVKDLQEDFMQIKIESSRFFFLSIIKIKIFDFFGCIARSGESMMDDYVYKCLYDKNLYTCIH